MQLTKLGPSSCEETQLPTAPSLTQLGSNKVKCFLIVYKYRNIHSFIFSNDFIPVRVMVEPENILETLGVKFDYNLNGTPGLFSDVGGN